MKTFKLIGEKGYLTLDAREIPSEAAQQIFILLKDGGWQTLIKFKVKRQQWLQLPRYV